MRVHPLSILKLSLEYTNPFFNNISKCARLAPFKCRHWMPRIFEYVHPLLLRRFKLPPSLIITCPSFHRIQFIPRRVRLLDKQNREGGRGRGERVLTSRQLLMWIFRRPDCCPDCFSVEWFLFGIDSFN